MTNDDEKKVDTLQELARLGHRFHGVDLSFRRSGTGWPAPWRAQLHATKNERSDYRMEGFGETGEEAVSNLGKKVASLDLEGYLYLDISSNRESSQ